MNDANFKELLAEVRRDIFRTESGLEELRRVEKYLAIKAEGQALLFDDTHSSAKPSGDLLGKTQAEAAEAVLLTAGHPLNTGAIVEAMVQRGYPDRTDRKQLENSVFSALRRAPDKFKKVSKGTWAIVNSTGGGSK